MVTLTSFFSTRIGKFAFGFTRGPFCKRLWKSVRHLSVKAFRLRTESRNNQKTKDKEMAGAAGLEASSEPLPRHAAH